MNFKIVSDSSSNVFEFSGVAFESVPLKIITHEKEYTDNAALNVPEMVEDLRCLSGPTSSSCPNIHEWLTAFCDADAVFALPITSSLSGSYSAAVNARQEYLASHPTAKVCVLDTLSTGGEMQLLMEKIRDGILAGDSFEQIERSVRSYQAHTHLLFALQSLNNLARNGRVNPAIAKIAGVLGICVVGKASDEGTLRPLHKCRGMKKALKTIVSEMEAMGFSGGKVCIDHCLNPEAAMQLSDALKLAYPSSDIRIGTCKALCSYYAEKGGLIIGFEDSRSTE